jgi:hypothetical protein
MPQSQDEWKPSADFLRQLEAAFRLLGYSEMGWDGSFITSNIADGFATRAQALEAESDRIVEPSK